MEENPSKSSDFDFQAKNYIFLFFSPIFQIHEFSRQKYYLEFLAAVVYQGDLAKSFQSTEITLTSDFSK